MPGHTYQYDELMRPIQRQNFWDATTSTTRNFTYNSRSELVNDQFLAGENFVYQYDNIGNRKISREQEGERYYNTNRLNQYILSTEKKRHSYLLTMQTAIKHISKLQQAFETFPMMLMTDLSPSPVKITV